MDTDDQRQSLKKRSKKNNSQVQGNSTNATGSGKVTKGYKVVTGGSAAPSQSLAVWSLYSLCSMLKYMIMMMVIPPFLNYASIQQEARLLVSNTTLYDIGSGQKMHFVCMGSGFPTVVLDAPTGMSLDAWSRIQPKLAEITKVCSYDRAGLGFSDRPIVNASVDISELHGGEDFSPELHKWQAFTVERMADDLHRLLQSSSKQETPMIMVGSELGGLVARFYTQLYESEVSDIVLLSPLVEDLFNNDDYIWSKFWFEHLVPSFQSLQMTASVGLNRIFLLMGFMEQPIKGEDISDEVNNRQRHFMCNPRHLSSIVDEHHFINESFSQMKTIWRLKPFPQNTSVTVITGNYYDEQLPSPLNKAWAKSEQHLMSSLHPTSHHIVINGADHHMLYKQPEPLIEQITKIIKHRRSKARRSPSS